MKVTQILFASVTMLGFLSTGLAAHTPPLPPADSESKHWGLECHEPAKRDTCKRFLVECEGRHADWHPGVASVCVDNCACVEHGATPPPAYGKDHPPQIPPLRPVSPFSLNSKAKKGGKKRDVPHYVYRRNML